MYFENVAHTKRCKRIAAQTSFIETQLSTCSGARMLTVSRIHLFEYLLMKKRKLRYNHCLTKKRQIFWLNPVLNVLLSSSYADGLLNRFVLCKKVQKRWNTNDVVFLCILSLYIDPIRNYTPKFCMKCLISTSRLYKSRF